VKRAKVWEAAGKSRLSGFSRREERIDWPEKIIGTPRFAAAERTAFVNQIGRAGNVGVRPGSGIGRTPGQLGASWSLRDLVSAGHWEPCRAGRWSRRGLRVGSRDRRGGFPRGQTTPNRNRRAVNHPAVERVPLPPPPATVMPVDGMVSYSR
jgi:hypothetical protein